MQGNPLRILSSIRFYGTRIRSDGIETRPPLHQTSSSYDRPGQRYQRMPGDRETVRFGCSDAPFTSSSSAHAATAPDFTSREARRIRLFSPFIAVRTSEWCGPLQLSDKGDFHLHHGKRRQKVACRSNPTIVVRAADFQCSLSSNGSIGSPCTVKFDTKRRIGVCFWTRSNFHQLAGTSLKAPFSPRRRVLHQATVSTTSGNHEEDISLRGNVFVPRKQHPVQSKPD